MGWHILDLRQVPRASTAEGVVWELVRTFGAAVHPIRAIPLAGFEDCAPYGPPAAVPARNVPAESGGSHCTVLVLDTGMWPHPALQGKARMLEPLDSDDLTWDSPNGARLRRFAGHGTLIAGVLLQRAADLEVLMADVTDSIDVDSRLGAYMVDEVQIAASLTKGLVEASRPNLIVNMSFATARGNTQSTGPLEDLIRWTKKPASGSTDLDPAVVPTEDRIVYVAAGGNVPGGTVTDTFPADLDEVISIGALNAIGTDVAMFSVSQGDIDAFAIGEDVYGPWVPAVGSTAPRFATWSGTSFAAPRVCASIARATDTAGSPGAAWRQLVPGTTKGTGAPRIG